MTRVAPNLPAETDLLCETCGYTLNGLPDDARCPECGKPKVESVDDGRAPSPWERRHGGGAGVRVGAFVRTTLAVLLRPTDFFRHLTARGSPDDARRFGHAQWAVASILFGWTTMAHWLIVTGDPVRSGRSAALFGSGFVLSFGLLTLTTWLAARLSTWEGTYRGLRLPLPTVRRCLFFHAAHYLPVGLVVAATTAVFLWAVRNNAGANFSSTYNLSVTYLYTISGEVVAAAVFLFWTYWIAMRNVMYANR